MVASTTVVGPVAGSTTAIGSFETATRTGAPCPRTFRVDDRVWPGAGVKPSATERVVDGNGTAAIGAVTVGRGVEITGN